MHFRGLIHKLGLLNRVWIILFFILYACKNEERPSDPLERNLILAGKNRGELEKVLTHYQKNPADSLKLKSAIFLISNMEDNKHFTGKWLDQFDQIFDRAASLDNAGLIKLRDSMVSEIGRNGKAKSKSNLDLHHLSADYLINNIDQAYNAWQKAPWKSSVSFDTFCNYILPYKSFNEYPEDWRRELYNRYHHLLNDPEIPQTMKDICSNLVKDEATWFKYSEVFFNYPTALSISSLLKSHKGACREMSNLATYSSRALGIPVAIDYTPQWGNHYDGHIWNALILNDSTFLPFLGAESRPGEYSAITNNETKLAKAYRINLNIIESSFAARARTLQVTDVPASLQNPRIKDVTSYYTETANIILDIKAKNGTPVYLCIFLNGDWRAVEGSFVEENKVEFKHMGRNILYLPMFYKSEKYIPSGPPILLPMEGEIKEIKKNGPELLTLKIRRKYPLKVYRAKWNLAQYLIHASFEGSNTSDFAKPTILYKAPEPMIWYHQGGINSGVIRDRLQYEQLWEKTTVESKDSFRFVRMKAGENIPFKLGELEFYSGDDTLPLTGIPIGNLPHPERAFDGTPGYSIIKEDEVEKDRWVGLDLGPKKAISKIRYLPASDKNPVLPGKTYELYYWKDKWVSMGIQKPVTHFIEYQGMPTGGLYWLHCLDCPSPEERPFTYENDQQVWW